MSQKQEEENDLPDCNDCGSNNWNEFHREFHGRNDRRVRKLECRECGAEGKVFDKGDDSTVYSGAMRNG